MRYPKLITIEFRKEEQNPGDGLHINVHWIEIFWCDESSMSYIGIASDTNEHGDYIWEVVHRLVSRDCYSFRGETYDFMAIRPIEDKEEGK
jgi:hypothetical protein